MLLTTKMARNISTGNVCLAERWKMGKLIYMFPRARLTLHHGSKIASSDRNSGRYVEEEELLRLFNKYFGGNSEPVQGSNQGSGRLSNEDE